MFETKQTYTGHALRRTRQRSIPPAFIDILQDFGVATPAGGGCTSFSIDKRGWRRAEAHFGIAAPGIRKVRQAYVVVSEDGAVVTAAWRD